MIASLEDVKRQLGGPGASDRAAEAMLEWFQGFHRFHEFQGVVLLR